jgi:hypothetical protein
MHDLSVSVFDLPDTEQWFAGDSRALEFQVVDGNGDPVPIPGATITWALFERAYQTDPADAVLSDGDAGVTVRTADIVDPEQGEFEVRVTPQATEGLYGEFYQRPVVEQSDGSTAAWRGSVVVEA